MARSTPSTRATKAQQSRAEGAVQERVRTAEVVLDVEVERGLVHLVLANCGDAVATDVRVKFSRRLLGLGGTVDLSTLPLFRGLGVLRPGRTLRVFWDAAHTLLGAEEQNGPFVATVSWTERARGAQQAEYRHDLAIYREWPEAVEPR
jgi:hypothetical protein